MRKLKEKCERIFSSVAFAEVGEAELACEVAGQEAGSARLPAWSFDRLMSAVTFAEANEHETALAFLDEKRAAGARKADLSSDLDDFLCAVGLSGAPVRYALVSA
jgi:hypothetical protein